MNTEQLDASVDIDRLDGIIEPYRGRREGLIPLLQEIQDAFTYVPREAIERVAAALDIYPVEIYGVITFYAQFYLQPRGRHTIRVCQGTACYIMGGKDVLDHLRQKLAVGVNESTADRRFYLETVACLGCCGMAPVVMIDNDFHGECNAQKIDEILERYE